jgi:N-acetyl-anhydromuramyl-L-alanine amidase AmpD
LVTTPVNPPLKGRTRTKQPTTVIIHATAGASAESSIAHLRKVGFSYDYIIERDGEVFKCKPVSSQYAYHAGLSEGPSGRDCNPYSIGICFANLNDGVEKVTESQIAAATSLIRELMETFPTVKWVATHHGVAPNRKSDPKGVDPRHMAQATGLTAWKMPLAKWLT